LAVDRYGVYITQNEFSLSSASTSPDAAEAFEGAQVYAISKRALVALRPEVGYVRYGDLSLGGMPGDCLQPADDRTAAPAEYFVSSFYRGYQTYSGLGVWALADEERLDSGSVPTMSATFVPSEVYGFPPTPQQAGEGPPLSDNDARVQDLTYRAGVLWGSLNTVVDAGGPANQAGVAWFAIAPTMQGDQLAGASLRDQGYVTARGASLVMGSLTVNADGQGGIVAGLVGPDDDPSAAYATFSADGARRGFSALHVVASGIGPARNGGCLAQYGYICTWGDYSAAITDGVDGDLWLATQYVPGPATPHENWGTRIWELQPAV
jgi:hypothetical protein